MNVWRPQITSGSQLIIKVWLQQHEDSFNIDPADWLSTHNISKL